MATKNNPGAYDFYAKAEPDEPLFVLLARDRHAPTLVWLWAVLREIDGEDPAVVKEAQENCVAMMAWAHDHGRKVCGLGQSVLAGILELIRASNAAVKDASNQKTDVEVIRALLAKTEFEAAGGTT